MRNSRLIMLVCLALVVVLALGYGASAKKPAKYVGSKECETCHVDSHPELMQAYPKTMHHSAMANVAAKPNAVVAKFDDDSPFKKEDIKYVLGTGREYQNYLDKDMKVLPGKWMVKEQKWVKADPVDGATQCVGCHATNFDPQTKKATELGVGCEMCHGPAGDHVDSMDVKDIVALSKLDSKKLNMVCGQCHAKGTDMSGKYAFPVSFQPGGDLSKFMKISPDATQGQNSQYNGFSKSKHAEGGMKCVSCHDTHGNKVKGVHQLKAPVNNLCLGCHSQQLGSTEAVKSLKDHAPTAAADATCASCHMEDGSHTFEVAK